MRVIYDAMLVRPPPQVIRNSLRTEVVVVGAGVAGLWLAHLLTAAGREVVVLEAEHAGFGASGRNGGILFPQPGLIWEIDGALPVEQSRWASREVALRAAASIGELHAFEGGALPVTMYLAAPSALAAQALRWVAPYLPNASWVGREALAARTGQCARAAVAFAAHVIQPKQLTRALYDHVVAAGARVYEGTRVVRVARNLVVTSEGHEIRARQIVIATGAWGAPRAAQTWMLASPRLSAQVIEGLGGESTVVATVDGAFTYRRIADGRLLFGGLDDSVRTPLDELRGNVESRLLHLVRRGIPTLPRFEPDAIWGGAIERRVHELPVVRRRADQAIELRAISGIHWAIVAAQLARGMVDPTLDTPDDARLRECIETTRLPIAGAAQLGARMVLRAVLGWGGET